ncbi:TetR-like C-terminal domain-containing protein, partial [Streptomyces anulatus]|uniref:TetR-like C-terminal domain-containing protein n=1 Tax=Streptomyces anulatus TaxID=1892 RepID=UPI00365153B2
LPAIMAVHAETPRHDSLRYRIRSAIVDRQTRLVLLGRQRAQARGELRYEDDASTAARNADLIFDVIAGAVVHRTLVSAEPVDPEWASGFTSLLLLGLAGAQAG